MESVAVHAGAGYQSEANKRKYLKLCRDATEKALESLKSGDSAVDAVVAAIACLEDHHLTNAGVGSNLCNDGTVECDASVMRSSDMGWGAVGALSGIKNPIKAAKLVLDEQSKEDSFGLIPPNLLVGQGALRWTKARGCAACDNLVSESAKSMFLKYKRKISQDSCEHSKHPRLDTVGAVAIDSFGHLAAGVSSGGILLKNPGRIGQAAMYGCGVWAENNVAVSTSGVGEYLTKTLFAKQCAFRLTDTDDKMMIEKLKTAFTQDFTESPLLSSVKNPRVAGVLSVFSDKETENVEVLWAHNTPTMCLAYGTQQNIKTVFSKLPDKSDIVLQSVPIKSSF